MRASTVRVFEHRVLALGIVGALLGAPAAGCRTATVSRHAPAATVPAEVAAARERARARPEIPYTAADAAQAYAVAKRLPLDRGVDTRAAYREATRHAAGMPVYSVAAGRLLTPAEVRSRGAVRDQIRGDWQPLGPGNIGGRMRTIAIDPGAPGTMYVGGVSGGVWKTTNGGASWNAVGDDLQNVAVNSLAMSPFNSDFLLAGTGEGYFREDIRGTGLPLRGGGIFRTQDGAASWEYLEATGGEDFYFVNDLVFSPGERAVAYAATRTGVWRTRDRGDTWSRVLPVAVQGGCLDLAIRTDSSADVLFASCGTFEQATVYRSLDAASGAAFEPVLSDPGMGRTSLAIAPSNQNVVYALAASNLAGDYEQGLHAVFRSSAGGAAGTWEARVRSAEANLENTLLLHNPVVAVSDSCGFGASTWIPMGWYVNSLAVDPANENVVWAAGVDWFRSDDGGRNWGAASYWWGSRGNPGWTHADQHTMVFHPDYDGARNQTVFVGNDGGIHRSDNARGPLATGLNGLCSPLNTGVEWTALNNGLEITQFYQGLPFPDGDGFLGGAQDNGTLLRQSGAGLNDWLPIFGGDGTYVAIDPETPTTLYAQSQNANVVKSTDGGATFSGATSGLPPGDGQLLDPGGNFLFVTPLVMDPNQSRTLWIGGKYVYRTVDGAASWQQVSKKLKKGSRVSALAIAPSDSNVVAVGTEKGLVYVNDRAGAASRSTRWKSKWPRRAWVTWVAFDPLDARVVYATYGGFGGEHVLRSGDGGRRWESIDGVGEGELPDIPVHCILVDPDDTSRLFIGTDLGVFVSTDGGQSWAQENAGFGNIVTESLALQRQAGKLMLYAFTHGRGAWSVEVAPS